MSPSTHPPLASRLRPAAGIRRGLYCAAVLALAAAPLSADAEASFKKALMAIDRQRYHEAVGHLQTAIGERPREAKAEVRIYGTWYEPYLPHYYLGVALARSGDCGGALAAWAESKRQGIVGGTARAATLGQLEQDCLAPTLLRAQQAVEAELLTANRLWQEVEARLATPNGRLAAARDPEIERGRAAARRDLDGAARAVDEAKAGGQLARMEQARDLAAAAGSQLRTVTLLVRAAEEGLPAGAGPGEATGSGSPPLPTASPTPGSASTSSPATPKGPAPVAAAATPPATGAGAGAATTASALPPGLVAAADALLAGDYRTALQRLATHQPSEPRKRAATALLRAAAATALAWRGAEGAEALLQEATRDVALARQLQPDLVLDGRFFSPRFRAFFAAAQKR